jgi:hypothetical protein
MMLMRELLDMQLALQIVISKQQKSQTRTLVRGVQRKHMMGR